MGSRHVTLLKELEPMKYHRCRSEENPADDF